VNEGGHGAQRAVLRSHTSRADDESRCACSETQCKTLQHCQPYALQAAERNRWRQYTSRDSQRINVSAWQDAAGRWRHSLGGTGGSAVLKLHVVANFTLVLSASSRVMGTVPSCSWDGLLRLGRVVSISALMSPMYGTRSRGSHKQRKCVHSSRFAASRLDAVCVAHQYSALHSTPDQEL
jgi:hypothetical protein